MIVKNNLISVDVSKMSLVQIRDNIPHEIYLRNKNK